MMRKPKPRSFNPLFAFAAMPARKKLVCLTTFLLVSAVTINNLFDMGIPEDDIYDANHLNRAQNRPQVDLTLELKDEVKKIEKKPKEKPASVRTGDASKKNTSDTEDGESDAESDAETTDETGDGSIYFDDTAYDDDDMDDIISDSAALLRAYDIEEKLEQISDNDALHDWTAPQGRAFQWIVNEDARMVLAKDVYLIQRYVLAVLFFATSGNSWHNGDLHWLSAVHECFWMKKIKGRPMGVVECNDDRRVTYIELVENNLQGSLPKEIGWLDHLISLDLQENRLTGTIPTTLGKIPSLKNVFINSNNLQGKVPSQLGNLANLTLLLLDTNELTGTIPDEICNLKNHSHLYSLW
eukprot:CAMPEP_0172489714 /NCGR_PEP_ID=MMETSP1066-20121228/19923_1 /TAXON_ID=671091 /ORGANISM="Coscinodiscus wailesii, Strain CCMP2513" /LENGTH=353 /DNA_ID=CAMNT_0013257791 /DNA_START=76 /DNA_END=1134 /DNA_ORIENTATION=-